MDLRNWMFSVLLCVSVGCGGNSTTTPDDVKPDDGEVVPEVSDGGDDSYAEPDYSEYYLEQNWDHATRMEWWFTSQGSRLVPYDWYLALEQVDSEELVRSEANMDRLRFISWPADSKWNPDGLPIGFVKDTDDESKKTYFGFTCAACHTGKIKFGEKEYIVEGGPAHSDFDRFVAQVGQSLQATLDDADKFARFAERVEGKDAKVAIVDGLKADLQIKSAELNERIKVNDPPHPNGYARLDAFGNIFNEGSVFAIDVKANVKPANAPVSYPVVWDTPQHKVVQWNGAAVNAGIGPYTRNVGEVVGVFGDLRIKETKVLGKKKLRFEHHVDIEGLERVEEILTTLWSPVWPEDMLGEIDRDKAAAGKVLYDSHCIKCHAVIADRTDPKRHIGEMMIPVKTLGTDSLAADNPINSTSKTGILKGTPMIPLLSILPSPGLVDKFEDEAPTKKVVGAGVLGILREELGLAKVVKGLPAYIKAAKANAGPARYKARPLNGIWASAPFLHNGSVANLQELLTQPEDRRKSFHVGSWVMDPQAVGFEIADSEHTSEFDASLPGNSNLGHDYGTGLTATEKQALIEYIKSL